jgi:hypothetical protein
MVQAHSQARKEDIRSVCSSLLISCALQIVIRRCGVGRSRGRLSTRSCCGEVDEHPRCGEVDDTFIWLGAAWSHGVVARLTTIHAQARSNMFQRGRIWCGEVEREVRSSKREVRSSKREVRSGVARLSTRSDPVSTRSDLVWQS